jgi:hypothetical protein
MSHPLLGKEIVTVVEFAGFYVSHSGLARGEFAYRHGTIAA